MDAFISSLEDKEEIPINFKFIELTKYKPYFVLYKGHPLEDKPSNEITNRDLADNKFIFDNKKNISMKSLADFIEKNDIKTSLDLGSCNSETIRFLIKNKMCVWFIFDIFLNEEDKKDFVFKHVKNFFADGGYGCFINKNNKKKILKDFIDFFVSKKEEIFKERIELNDVI